MRFILPSLDNTLIIYLATNQRLEGEMTTDRRPRTLLTAKFYLSMQALL